MPDPTELRSPLLEEPESASPTPNSKGEKIRWTIRTELRRLLGVSIPIAVATIARLAISFTDTAFVGHLGTVCLSASSLALNWSSVLADLMWTAGYSLNSLGSQAIGAKQYTMAGEWLQLASVAVVILCLFCIVGYFFTDDVIGLISNDTAVVELSLEFNVFSTLALIPTALYMTVRQLFQAMRIVLPATVVSIISIGFNVGMNQLLVHGFVTDSWTNTSDDASLGNTTRNNSAFLDPQLFHSALSGIGRPAGRMIALAQSNYANTGGELSFSDPNRTWPWPSGQTGFPIAFENGTFAGFGFPGSPLATTTSMCFQLTVFYVFCFCIKKYHRKYWGGWTCRSFSRSRIAKYLKVVIPMTIGNCVEDWGYQVLAYLSGSLGPTDVAAISVMFSTWGILWAFYWGWGLALQVRVGFHLGNGKIKRAKAVAKISFFIVLTIVGTLTASCYLLRWELPKIFTGDDHVIDTVADSMIYLCMSYFLGCLNLCGCSILEGMSRNSAMALVQGLGTWVLHVPLTIYLMLYCPYFKPHPVRAFWIGSAAAELTKGSIMWLLVFTSDWDKQMRLAKERNEADPDDVSNTDEDDVDDIDDTAVDEEILIISDDQEPVVDSDGCVTDGADVKQETPSDLAVV